MSDAEKTSVVTPEFRLSYPKLFKPEINKLSKKLEFSCVALFALGQDLGKLKKAAFNAAVKKFGPDQAKWPKNKDGTTMSSPFRDQADREKEHEGVLVMPAGYIKGAIYINLKSTQRPAVVDQNVQAILDESKIYGGCYCYASVNFSAFKHESGKVGVSCYLNNIQLSRDGDPFGTRTRAEDDFKAIDTAQLAAAGATGSSSTGAGLFD